MNQSNCSYTAGQDFIKAWAGKGLAGWLSGPPCKALLWRCCVSHCKVSKNRWEFLEISIRLRDAMSYMLQRGPEGCWMGVVFWALIGFAVCRRYRSVPPVSASPFLIHLNCCHVWSTNRLSTATGCGIKTDAKRFQRKENCQRMITSLPMASGSYWDPTL